MWNWIRSFFESEEQRDQRMLDEAISQSRPADAFRVLAHRSEKLRIQALSALPRRIPDKSCRVVLASIQTPEATQFISEVDQLVAAAIDGFEKQLRAPGQDAGNLEYEPDFLTIDKVNGILELLPTAADRLRCFHDVYLESLTSDTIPSDGPYQGVTAFKGVLSHLSQRGQKSAARQIGELMVGRNANRCLSWIPEKVADAFVAIGHPECVVVLRELILPPVPDKVAYAAIFAIRCLLAGAIELGLQKRDPVMEHMLQGSLGNFLRDTGVPALAENARGVMAELASPQTMKILRKCLGMPWREDVTGPVIRLLKVIDKLELVAGFSLTAADIPTDARDDSLTYCVSRAPLSELMKKASPNVRGPCPLCADECGS
jgi:hypothetical protein